MLPFFATADLLFVEQHFFTIQYCDTHYFFSVSMDYCSVGSVNLSLFYHSILIALAQFQKIFIQHICMCFSISDTNLTNKSLNMTSAIRARTLGREIKPFCLHSVCLFAINSTVIKWSAGSAVNWKLIDILTNIFIHKSICSFHWNRTKRCLCETFVRDSNFRISHAIIVK